VTVTGQLAAGLCTCNKPAVGGIHVSAGGHVRPLTFEQRADGDDPSLPRADPSPRSLKLDQEAQSWTLHSAREVFVQLASWLEELVRDASQLVAWVGISLCNTAGLSAGELSGATGRAGYAQKGYSGCLHGHCRYVGRAATVATVGSHSIDSHARLPFRSTSCLRP
jgi:hypothetical protein